MPVKIRLTRQGRKKRSYYHIIVADSRAPRDGRFIETLGNYDPNTNPATIELDFEKSLNWVLKGAQPTDTCRAILSYKGVMYKKHLMEGVQKNAFSEEEAEKKFVAWLTQKEAKIQAKRDTILQSKGDLNKKRLEAEAKANEKRAQEIAKKLAKLAAKEAGEEAAEEVIEVPAPAKTPVAETPVAAIPVAEIPPEVAVTDEIPAADSPVASEATAEDAETKESEA
jgi:small subunit ribosomal protein S16